MSPMDVRLDVMMVLLMTWVVWWTRWWSTTQPELVSYCVVTPLHVDLVVWCVVRVRQVNWFHSCCIVTSNDWLEWCNSIDVDLNVWRPRCWSTTQGENGFSAAVSLLRMLILLCDTLLKHDTGWIGALQRYRYFDGCWYESRLFALESGSKDQNDTSQCTGGR